MSGAHRYVAVQNTTASKERLMVRLFDTAVAHMRNAIRHLEAKDRRSAMPLLDKASQIVAYLQGTLSRDTSPKLVDDLRELYTFTVARLARAIITANPADVREAERAFAPVADGFSRAVENMSRQQATAPRP